MTYSSRLKATQLLKDWPGNKSLSSDVVDDLIEKEERRILKRRVVCPTCHTLTSTSGSCFC